MVANFEKRVVGSVDVLIDTHQRANGYESFVSRRSQRSVYVNSFSETSDGQICVCGDPKARPGLHLLWNSGGFGRCKYPSSHLMMT